MITPQIDRCRQNDRAPAGRFREARQKIVASYDRRAVPHRAQKFFEILSAQWSPVFLFAKHDRVVEIEHDPAIRPLKKVQLQFVETNRLEKNNEIMPSRFT
jgi:hypothetical protein